MNAVILETPVGANKSAWRQIAYADIELVITEVGIVADEHAEVEIGIGQPAYEMSYVTVLSSPDRQDYDLVMPLLVESGARISVRAKTHTGRPVAVMLICRSHEE